MPLRLRGSCRCGAVAFGVQSHTPYPYQLCYCGICRKTAGGGGFAINIMGVAATLEVTGRESITVFRATVDEGGSQRTSTGERNFCRGCGTALWLWDEQWPELIHPFAAAIETKLPTPPERTHLMLRFKPAWVEPTIGLHDKTFDLYPDESIEQWHRSRDLWVA